MPLETERERLHGTVTYFRELSAACVPGNRRGDVRPLDASGNETRINAGKRLAEIFAHVRQTQPTWGFLVAGYSGCGDSGSIEYVGFLESRDQADAAEFWERPAALQTAFPEGVTDEELSDLLDHFLPSGFENNDGGQGVVRVDLATGTIDVAHEWCVSAVDADPRSYLLDVVTGTLLERSASLEA